MSQLSDILCLDLNHLSASPKDIDIAVAAAREAFKTTWGKNVTGWERARLMNKLADLIERDAQELGELETLNNGKPVKIARYEQDSVVLCSDSNLHFQGTSTLVIVFNA